MKEYEQNEDRMEPDVFALNNPLRRSTASHKNIAPFSKLLEERDLNYWKNPKLYNENREGPAPNRYQQVQFNLVKDPNKSGYVF